MKTFRALFVTGIGAVAFFGASCVSVPKQQIDPEAQQLLKQMSVALAAAKSFTFESTVSMDEESENGQMVRVARHSTITVSRPDRVNVEVTGDDGERTLWLAGKSLTLLNRESMQYATIKVPGSIDAALDFIMDEYGVSLPLADLVYADPYSVLTEKVQTGIVLGRESVQGHECDHLLFTQENVDWQVWVDAGEIALPRQVVISQKNEPGCPQFTAIIDNWDLSATPTAKVFTFGAAESTGATAVPMAELLNVE